MPLVSKQFDQVPDHVRIVKLPEKQHEPGAHRAGCALNVLAQLDPGDHRPLVAQRQQRAAAELVQDRALAGKAAGQEVRNACVLHFAHRVQPGNAILAVWSPHRFDQDIHNGQAADATERHPDLTPHCGMCPRLHREQRLAGFDCP